MAYSSDSVDSVEGLKSQLWLATIAGYAILLIPFFATLNLNLIGDPKGFHLTLGPVFLLIILVHVSLSFVAIGADERAVLYFFGRYVGELNPGPHLLPAYGLVNFLSFRYDLRTIQIPGPAESIDWGDEKQALTKGKVRPLLVNTRQAKSGETGKLDVSMTLGVTAMLLWRIVHPALFFMTLHSPDEADDQLRRLCERLTNEIIAEGTVDDAIAERAAINEKLKMRLDEESELWGVQITQAAFTQVNLSHALASVMRDRAEAGFKAETLVLDAEAKAKATVLQGEAAGKASEAEAAGRAKGYKFLKSALRVDGYALLGAEVAEKTIPNAPGLILGATGLEQLGGIGKIVAKGMKGE